jgi:prepilin-type N-terminal cleavage/methylation domain-containing protein
MRVQARCTPRLVVEVVDMNRVTEIRECSRSRGGFTMAELLTVLLLIGVMVGMAGTQYSSYLEKTLPDRASRLVGSYVSSTRSLAIQRRDLVTLAVDPGSKTIMIRTETDTLRTMDFGPDSELELTVLDTNLLGDSITFNARGICSVCGVSGKGITVSGPRTSYLITFNALGRWKRTLQ